MESTVAELLAPLIERLLGSNLPVAVRYWDGSTTGDESAGTTVTIRSQDALRRLLYAPNELGLGRAYVAGDIDIEGNVFEALSLRDNFGAPDSHVEIKLDMNSWFTLLRSARSVGALGRPLRPPPEEARLHGALHSRRRDAQAISHHYDVSNDFYRLVLGPTMTYSCAYFDSPQMSLNDAQTSKYDLICRKLGLQRGMRFLDVGCGWGGMLMHAARRYGVKAVGITLSRPQADLAEKRIAEEGLADMAEVRVQDYRDVRDGPFDAISSIGMFEHVGFKRLQEYFGSLRRLLSARGRFLNHAISRPGGDAGFDKRSFISRYVFPDGELHEVGRVVTAMQENGFEVRDLESLREQYALTLRSWVSNLEASWDEARRLAGDARARIWRLYMAGSALGFEAGRISVHQVLGVSSDGGSSGIPLRRAEFLA
jgi:cyclopropane-fatty-acyl-phospholipid synthase